ncbi:MAG: DUF2723 domain-containing protein [Patescibacteria group bacterium]
MRKYVPYILGILAFVLPLALYVRTLFPTYVPIDSAEFALCTHFWGLCHPPGFPLYVFLGKIFTTVWPWGSVIYRANLFSAIFGALIILMVYLTLKSLKVDSKIAILLSLILAVSATFWEFSISADVFTFGAFLVAGSFYLAINQKRTAAFFLLGLSASHFYITGVLWPVFYWYFYKIEVSNVSKESKGAKAWFLSVIIYGFVFALGFFPQILMFFRAEQNPEINWGHPSGLVGFIDYVRRKEFGSGFLISNPVLTFHLAKFFKHFYFYFRETILEFAAVLPLFMLGGFFVNDKGAKRKFWLILSSLAFLVFIQLFLLSTIDPGGDDNPFQINKFYINFFVLMILALGVGISEVKRRFFEGSEGVVALFLGIILLLYLAVNFRTHDFSQNRFTENFVLDGLSTLPGGSLIITVDHPFYFGSLYEQKVNGKFTDATMLYFPNEKNRDSQNYHPEVFNRAEDTEFVEKVKEGKSLGAAEAYVLSTISKNLDKPIYIVQGSFEDSFFRYLKPYIEPYGLFWRVKPNLSEKTDKARAIEVFNNLRNRDFKKSDFEIRQQGFEAVTYAISYHSTGALLGSLGDIDGAQAMFKKSLAIDGTVTSVRDELDLLEKIETLSRDKDKLIAEKNDMRLGELGNFYFSIGDYKDSVEIFEHAITINQNSAQFYNNAASSYANLGQMDKAQSYYKEALALDPKLDLARQGLENLQLVNGQ